MRKTTWRVLVSASLVVLPLAAWTGLHAAPKGPEKDPVKLAVDVSPDSVAPGGEAEVTLRITPNPGIKVNRYPRIKLDVPAEDGLVAAASASIGSDAPPPPDQLETNYYKTGVDPVHLKLRIGAQAPKGRHELPARVTYFYCVAASGYCAPAKAPITIPVTVR